jgi:hypothetical protein
MEDAVTLQHKKILLKKPVLSILKFFIFSSLKVAGWICDPRDPPHN